MPASRYRDEAALRATTDRLLERIRAVPGVEGVGMTTTLPFSGSYSDSVILAEGYQMQPGESLISPCQVSASDGYFEAMGATLVAGRYFTTEDTEGRRRVLIIDNRLAKRFWPNGDALGKRMYFPADISNIMAKPTEDADDDHRRHHRADATARAGRYADRRRLAPISLRCDRQRREPSDWRFARRRRPSRSSRPCAARSRRSIRRCRSTACARWKIA